MTDREKLIKLIGNIQLRGCMERRKAKSIAFWAVSNEDLADYLLSHGVVILDVPEAKTIKVPKWEPSSSD